jgi:hypothetical protein
MIVGRFRGVSAKIGNIVGTPQKHPTAITLSKSIPETSGWTQKTRLGFLYNLCAKSGAEIIFRRSYGDLGVFDLTTQPYFKKQNVPRSETAEERLGGHPDERDSRFVSITRRQMPIVSSYTVARRQQPSRLGCVRPTGRPGAICHNNIHALPRALPSYDTPCTTVPYFYTSFPMNVFSLC